MTAAIDITAGQRKTLLALLRRYIPGVAVWAYGSRVKWTARPNSDLDLVAFSTPEQQPLVSELKEALAESDLPFLVDFHVWDEVPERFHEIIRKEYIVLQEAKEKQVSVGKTDEWRESTWGEEISLEYGKSLRGYDTVSGKFQVFGSNGPIGWTSKPLTNGPGVVLGRKGAYRGVQYSQKPFFVIDTAYYVVPKTQLDIRWVYYAIKHHKLGEIDDGSPIPSTTRSAVYVKELSVPSPTEQKAIAHILGTLDDKIELNRQMNATLEAMARALFQSWFVDFDPVRAKLDGRKPAGLDAATAELFPAHFQDSPLGHIPQGWHVGSVYEIADVIYGAPFSSALFNSHKIGKPLVRIRDLYDENPAIFTTEILPKGYLLKPGDIVVGMDGEFRAHLWGGVESWLNQRVCVFAPKQGYSAAFVRNSIFALLAQVEATETATTVIHLGKNDIDRFNIIVPDVQVVDAFNKICQRWYDCIVINKQQSRTLATLRDALLPKLLSGELSVKDNEQFCEVA